VNRSSRLLLGSPVAGLAALAAYDLTQRRHALRRNFPVVAHLRYLREKFDYHPGWGGLGDTQLHDLIELMTHTDSASWSASPPNDSR
jgi:hypothetical protein